MAVTTRTIIGRVLDAARKPTLDGEYRFTPTQEMVTTSGDFIPKRPTIARFTSGDGADAGKFTVDLIANDSDDLAQTAGTWRVQLVLDSRPGRIQREWNIVVPKEGSGTGANGTGPIELGDLTPVTQPGEVAAFLTEAVADQRYILANALPSNLITEDNIGDYLDEVDLTGYATTEQLAPVATAASTAQTLAQKVALVPVNPDDVGYDIVLLLGQSNMSGGGQAAVDSKIDVPDSRVWQFGSVSGGSYAGVILQASDPLQMVDMTIPITGMGPGLTFARWYAQMAPVNRRVLLCPGAFSGTSMIGVSGYAPASVYTWGPGRTDKTNLYELAITQAKNALAAAGPNSRIVAALWLQGETDGDLNNSGSAYQTALDTLIDGLRSRLGVPDLPFIVGGMVPEYLSTGTRAAINSVHLNTPARKTTTAFAPNVPGANRGDGNHYNATGIRAMGRGMFDAYRAALTNVTGTAPQAPAAVTVTATSSTAATVTWSRPVGRFTNFKVETSTDGTTWTTVTRTASAALNQSLTGLTGGQSVTARVSTINEQGTSAATASSPITMPQVPGQVTGLTAGTATGDTIPLSWSVPSGSPTSYTVQFKKSSDSSWTTATTTATSPSYTLSGLTVATSYDVRVSASNVTGTGTYSATLTISTAATVPGTPSITATAKSSAVTIAGSAQYASTYDVYRGTSSGAIGSKTLLAAGTGVTLPFDDTTGTVGTTYYYQVIGKNGSGSSPASNEVSAAPLPADTRPVSKPSTTAQPSLWLRGDKLTQSGGNVTAWPDFGGAYASSVPSGKTAPTYVASAINSLPGASFVKTVPNGLTWAKSIKAESQTILMVATMPTPASSFLLGGTDGNDVEPAMMPLLYTSGSALYAAGVKGATGTSAFGTVVTANAPFIARATYTAARQVKVATSGGTVGTSSLNSYTATPTVGLGIGAIGTDTATYTVCEVIVFDAELSEADAHAWTVYLGQVYGITVGAN